MRILFYLPAVTPWWFERIIVPLVEKLVVENEVHIMAPIVWRGTGVAQRDYDLCAHLPQVAWHIVTDQDHTSMRTNAAQRVQIVDFVRQLNPSFVFCRTADFETVNQFPGIVRHITEGGADPLLLPVGAVHFTKSPFDHGVLPQLGNDHIARLWELMEPHWECLINAAEAQPSALGAFREWANLPCDRPTVFLPLEYEHEENFYTRHRQGPTPNAALVQEVTAMLGGRALLALTNHPLNELYVDNSALEELVSQRSDDIKLMPEKAPSGHRSTPLLMRCVDGVLLGDSKTYALAGFCGTPIMRQSRFRTGEWLNACDNLEEFLVGVLSRNAARPDARMARIWFAFHVANNLVAPSDPRLTGSELLGRMAHPFDPSRWERNFNFFAAGWGQSDEIAA